MKFIKHLLCANITIHAFYILYYSILLKLWDVKYYYYCHFLVKRYRALAGWLRWLEHHVVHQKVVGLIPGQGTYLDCGFGPQSGSVQEGVDHLSLSPSPFSFFLFL